MADSDKLFGYMILDGQDGRCIGHCLTRESAMDYAEVMADAGVMRSILCARFPSKPLDDWLDGLSDFKAQSPEAFERVHYGVYDAGSGALLAYFYERDHADEFSRLLSDAGRGCSVSPMRLPDPDALRDSARPVRQPLRVKPDVVAAVVSVFVIAAAVWSIGNSLSVW